MQLILDLLTDLQNTTRPANISKDVLGSGTASIEMSTVAGDD
jgi:hypothetical protein